MTESAKTEALEIALKAIQMYASMHPWPAHFTRSQAAEMLGVSKGTIQNYIHSGILDTNRPGQITAVSVKMALEAR